MKHKGIAVLVGIVLLPGLLLSGIVMIVLIAVLGSTSGQSNCTPNAPVDIQPIAGQVNTVGDTVKGAPAKPDQIANANTIISIAKQRGLSKRDAKIALMVGIQESTLRNLTRGDRDSGGVFQQRPSQGWGSAAQVRNVVYATNAFYNHLVKVPRRDQLSLLQVALAVQRPGAAAYSMFNNWASEADKFLGDKYTDTDPSSTVQTVADDSSCAVGGVSSSVLEVAVQNAMSQIGTPYRWGDEVSGFGFDCSGLVQWAFKQAGVTLPRTSREQYTVGTHVTLDQLQRGDLVFWGSVPSQPGTINHVGIYLGENQIINAPHPGAPVRVETMYTSYPGSYFVGGTRVADPAQLVPASGDWQLPLAAGSYTLSSPYGLRFHPVKHVWRLHDGADFAAPQGTPIHAAAAGIIIHAGFDDDYGNYIIIQHQGGILTGYAHQVRFALGIGVGSTVRAGQLIGYVGQTGSATGPHLHFNVRLPDSIPLQGTDSHAFGLKGVHWTNPLPFLRQHGLSP